MRKTPKGAFKKCLQRWPNSYFQRSLSTVYINFLSVDISTIFTRKDSRSTMVFYIIGIWKKKKEPLQMCFKMLQAKTNKIRGRTQFKKIFHNQIPRRWKCFEMSRPKTFLLRVSSRTGRKGKDAQNNIKDNIRCARTKSLPVFESTETNVELPI